MGICGGNFGIFGIFPTSRPPKKIFRKILLSTENFGIFTRFSHRSVYFQIFKKLKKIEKIAILKNCEKFSREHEISPAGGFSGKNYVF